VAKLSNAPGALLAQSGQVSIYAVRGANVALSANAITAAAGGNGPHENLMPSLTVTFIICLNGIYPAQ
jgi:microcystin-dependent protein